MPEDPTEKDDTFLAADLLPEGCIEDLQKITLDEDEEEAVVVVDEETGEEE